MLWQEHRYFVDKTTIRLDRIGNPLRENDNIRLTHAGGLPSPYIQLHDYVLPIGPQEHPESAKRRTVSEMKTDSKLKELQTLTENPCYQNLSKRFQVENIT